MPTNKRAWFSLVDYSPSRDVFASTTELPQGRMACGLAVCLRA